MQKKYKSTASRLMRIVLPGLITLVIIANFSCHHQKVMSFIVGEDELKAAQNAGFNKIVFQFQVLDLENKKCQWISFVTQKTKREPFITFAIDPKEVRNVFITGNCEFLIADLVGHGKVAFQNLMSNEGYFALEAVDDHGDQIRMGIPCPPGRLD
jgi:hypothetical protein